MKKSQSKIQDLDPPKLKVITTNDIEFELDSNYASSLIKIFYTEIDNLFKENNFLNGNGFIIKQQKDIVKVPLYVLMYSVDTKQRK